MQKLISTGVVRLSAEEEELYPERDSFSAVSQNLAVILMAEWDSFASLAEDGPESLWNNPAVNKVS